MGFPGRDKATLRKFFDALGDERSAQITHVSADAAAWIATVVAECCPDVVRVADPFHVVMWATDALHEERRSAWNRARKAARENEPGRGRGRPSNDAPPRPDSEQATKLKNSRYALWKNPEDLTEKQQVKLAWIVQTDPRLGRPTTSRKVYAPSSSCPTRMPSWPWTDGSRGPGAVGFLRS